MIRLRAAWLLTFFLLQGCDSPQSDDPGEVLDSAAAAIAESADNPSARNMRLIGQHDLQGRSAYQPIVHRYGDRRIGNSSIIRLATIARKSALFGERPTC